MIKEPKKTKYYRLKYDFLLATTPPQRMEVESVLSTNLKKVEELRSDVDSVMMESRDNGVGTVWIQTDVESFVCVDMKSVISYNGSLETEEI